MACHLTASRTCTCHYVAVLASFGAQFEQILASLIQGTIKALNIVVEIDIIMENLGLTPQQLNAIKGLLKEGKIQNLFVQAGESTNARSGGIASQVNDLSRSRVAQVNKAVNNDACTMQENNLNGELENSASDMILLGVGNSDDTKKFSARELLEKAPKCKKASEAQQTFRVS